MEITKGIIAMLTLALLAGCGDIEEPAPQAEPPVVAETNEVEKIVPTELQVVVGEYEVAVKAKLAELETLKKKVKEIPIEEMVSEQAEVIRGAMEDVADSLGKMMEELSGQLDELLPEAGQK